MTADVVKPFFGFERILRVIFVSPLKMCIDHVLDVSLLMRHLNDYAMIEFLPICVHVIGCFSPEFPGDDVLVSV